jgi:hypothetical protein
VPTHFSPLSLASLSTLTRRFSPLQLRTQPSCALANTESTLHTIALSWSMLSNAFRAPKRNQYSDDPLGSSMQTIQDMEMRTREHQSCQSLRTYTRDTLIKPKIYYWTLKPKSSRNSVCVKSLPEKVVLIYQWRLAANLTTIVRGETYYDILHFLSMFSDKYSHNHN